MSNDSSTSTILSIILSMLCRFKSGFLVHTATITIVLTIHASIHYWFNGLIQQRRVSNCFASTLASPIHLSEVDWSTSVVDWHDSHGRCTRGAIQDRSEIARDRKMMGESDSIVFSVLLLIAKTVTFSLNFSSFSCCSQWFEDGTIDELE